MGGGLRRRQWRRDRQSCRPRAPVHLPDHDRQQDVLPRLSSVQRRLDDDGQPARVGWPHPPSSRATPDFGYTDQLDAYRERTRTRPSRSSTRTGSVSRSRTHLTAIPSTRGCRSLSALEAGQPRSLRVRLSLIDSSAGGQHVIVTCAQPDPRRSWSDPPRSFSETVSRSLSRRAVSAGDRRTSRRQLHRRDLVGRSWYDRRRHRDRVGRRDDRLPGEMIADLADRRLYLTSRRSRLRSGAAPARLHSPPTSRSGVRAMSVYIVAGSSLLHRVPAAEKQADRGRWQFATHRLLKHR